VITWSGSLNMKIKGYSLSFRADAGIESSASEPGDFCPADKLLAKQVRLAHPLDAELRKQALQRNPV
jgi:hypothetical protein